MEAGKSICSQCGSAQFTFGGDKFNNDGLVRVCGICHHREPLRLTRFVEYVAPPKPCSIRDCPNEGDPFCEEHDHALVTRFL